MATPRAVSLLPIRAVNFIGVFWVSAAVSLAVSLVGVTSAKLPATGTN